MLVTKISTWSRAGVKRGRLRIPYASELGWSQTSDDDGRDGNDDGGNEENGDDEMEKMKDSPYIIREQEERVRLDNSNRFEQVCGRLL